MEDFNLISGLTAVPASVIIIYVVWKFAPVIVEKMKSKNGVSDKNFRALNEKLDSITGNHLDHVVDALCRIEDTLERINDNNNRNFSELKESLAYLKAKSNGK